MVPGAFKGRSAKARPPAAIPLAPDVITKLERATIGRDSNETLLLRWAYKREKATDWQKDHRRGWGPAYEVLKLWGQVVTVAELPSDCVMYALRHSSIVRGLKVGLPVRLVAALHDTSTAMIEKHYSSFILDMTEELARRASISFGEAPANATNLEL
jgi:hypothetical protein